MEDVDAMRDRWLMVDDEPDEPEAEPTDEEFESQLNDHKLRAWDYLVDNSEAIDAALEGLILHPQDKVPPLHLADIAALLKKAVEATRQ